MTDAASAEALDAAILRAERRLRLLEELAEIGMDLARALHREALAEPAKHTARETPFFGDPVDAFVRVSHVIRLILALEARTDEALRGLRAEMESKREAGRIEAGPGVIRTGAAHRMQ
jgi:hypothetical protein